jgi:hypothetical protein
MATIEALLLWVPVFGYNAGGTKELISDESWFLVEHKDMESLILWFETFQMKHFSRNTIKNLTIKKLWLW